MALDKLSFTKNWTKPEDFPTIETSEAQVRLDMQQLHDETKEFINSLISTLEGLGVETTVQLPTSAGMKYIRLNSNKCLEVSSDGKTWQVPGGGGSGPVTPDSIGALPITGGTVAGHLNVKSFSLSDYSSAMEIGKNIDFHLAGSTNDFDARLAYDSGALLFRLLGGDYKTIIHTGNLSDLGVAKIATGSYVGTGVYGEANPNRLTLPFEPKVVMICSDTLQLLYGTSYGNHSVFGVLWEQLSRDYKLIGSNRYNGMMVKATDNTLSWYTADTSGSSAASSQLNTSGNVYRYVAIG